MHRSETTGNYLVVVSVKVGESAIVSLEAMLHIQTPRISQGDL